MVDYHIKDILVHDSPSLQSSVPFHERRSRSKDGQCVSLINPMPDAILVNLMDVSTLASHCCTEISIHLQGRAVLKLNL